MPLRKFVEKFTKPVDEQDREQLVSWCAERGGAPLDGLELRRPVRIVGEIRSVRIVPRAGAASLEATVQDGRGTVTAVFLGRRKIAGLSPGRRVQLEGVVTKHRSANSAHDCLVYNPVYQLL
ncbi:MAG TPA: OB-fold nucleic acid binding domain-containing protein [Acidimicrobiia bacterium]